jgi:hypothetical protein
MQQSSPSIQMVSTSTTASVTSRIIMKRETHTTGTSVLNDDRLGEFDFHSGHSSLDLRCASIQVRANENHVNGSPDNLGTKLLIHLTTNDTATEKISAKFTAETGNTLYLDGTVATSQYFTEGHQYFAAEELEAGDCCVLIDGQLSKSSSPMQKNVAGLAWYNHYADRIESDWDFGGWNEAKTYYWPKEYNDSMGTYHFMSEWSGVEGEEPVLIDKYKLLWKVASLGDSKQFSPNSTENRMGTGLGINGIKICNENGPVEAGDLLCTSSTPGYLMKQSDDLMHSYTVAKAMENVTFDENGQAADVYGYIYCG